MEKEDPISRLFKAVDVLRQAPLAERPDSLLQMGLIASIYAERYDLLDAHFDELDRRRLERMEEPEREEELQMRKRIEERTGATYKDYFLRLQTIALIGSPEEKAAMRDAHLVLAPRPNDTYQQARLYARAAKLTEELLGIPPTQPPPLGQ